jgi:four helix bundle protein
MATLRKFEDIKAWQDAIALADAVYAATREPSFAKDFGLCDQMRRAAVSVSSNIAEGFERETNVEFARFLTIAKGSAGELRSQLYVARNAGYIDNECFDSLYTLSTEIGRRLAHFISYLKRSPSTPPSAASNDGPAVLKRGRSTLQTPPPAASSHYFKRAPRTLQTTATPSSNAGATRFQRAHRALQTPPPAASNPL